MNINNTYSLYCRKFKKYLHRTFSHCHIEILYNMVRILIATISFESMSDANCLLAIPSEIV